MFFRSWKSLLLTKVMIVVGCVLLYFGWIYADAAKREATTVGTITHVVHGKGSTYEYVFKINGVNIKDDSGTCHTALTPSGCTEGALVLVHYDREHLSENMLEGFGAASRERLFMGAWMIFCGLLLIGLYFVLKKANANSDESDDSSGSDHADQSDVLHIVPGE